MGVAVALVHGVVDVDDVGGLQHEGVLRHRLHHRRRVVRVDDHAVDLLVVAALDVTRNTLNMITKVSFWSIIIFKPELPSPDLQSCPSSCVRRRDTASAP